MTEDIMELPIANSRVRHAQIGGRRLRSMYEQRPYEQQDIAIYLGEQWKTKPESVCTRILMFENGEFFSLCDITLQRYSLRMQQCADYVSALGLSPEETAHCFQYLERILTALPGSSVKAYKKI